MSAYTHEVVKAYAGLESITNADAARAAIARALSTYSGTGRTPVFTVGKDDNGYYIDITLAEKTRRLVLREDGPAHLWEHDLYTFVVMQLSTYGSIAALPNRPTINYDINSSRMYSLE